jgi:hypothetical protein
MSEFTGTLPPNWGYPAPVYVFGSYREDGMVWLGTAPATEEDIQALKDCTAETVRIDERSLPGLYDWQWTTFGDQIMYMQDQGEPHRKMGGINSDTYELQFVGGGDGAQFRTAEEGDMWYVDTSGNMLYGIPPENAGCYHKVDTGGGYYHYVEGVEQGSAADRALGQGEFFWDTTRRLYDVR